MNASVDILTPMFIMCTHYPHNIRIQIHLNMHLNNQETKWTRMLLNQTSLIYGIFNTNKCDTVSCILASNQNSQLKIIQKTLKRQPTSINSY